MQVDPPADLPWKEYIAKHEMAESIVGNGLVSFSLCFLGGTTDPNRYGQMRLDYVAKQVQTDGATKHVYIHPGSKPRGDAKIRFIDEPADAWLRDKDKALRDLMAIPQHLRYGREGAFEQLHAVLRDVAEGTLLDITTGATEHGALFPYWLWLANLGALTRSVQTRLTTAALLEATCQRRNDESVWLHLRFQDGFRFELGIRMDPKRGLRTVMTTH